MHSEYLYTISEIAVAVAGFAGIVVALLGTQGISRDRQSLDLTLIRNVLGSTFIAIGSSLISITLLEMGFEELLVWKASSILVAVVITIYVSAHLPAALKSYRAAGANFPWTYVMNALILLV